MREGGIMDLWTREARLFKYGSGTGSNFSDLRGDVEPLSGGGVSSGLMSFLKIGDTAAGSIKSGGTTRRAAKMVCLDADHPDIEQFINWKVHEEQKVAALVSGSKTIKNISLELGGNAPFIVFSDANIDLAIEGLINAKFRNAGQTCISANRIFIHKKISKNFLPLVIKKLKSLKVGSGLLNSDLGPLISKEALSKVNNHILDAKKKGE